MHDKLNDEAGRLASLRRYDVLDTAPELPYDKITQLVKMVLNVPIVAVSLIDAERQWFKSCVGLDVRETERDISFCTHTIKTREPMVIHDAKRDPRFAQNPLVLGAPFIASYAGAPLLTPDGYALGSLCAIDTVPRQFDAGQIDVLKSFAALVVDEFELRRRAHADRLTGALSRRAFLEEAERALSHYYRHDLPSSIAVIDIDHFKQSNDAYGHAAGDAMLRACARVINAQSRPGDSLARLGGDEFAVLMTGADAGQAMMTAERCRTALGAMSFPHDPSLRITASFGIATLSPAYATAEKWLAAANLALDDAKESGRNKCCTRAEEVHEADQETYVLHRKLEGGEAALADLLIEDEKEPENNAGQYEEHKLSVQPLSRALWTKLQRLPQVKTVKTGRLAYGGLHPGIVSCRILDITETGHSVATNVKLSPMPEFFSVEFCEIYCRAKMCRADGREIDLEFIFDGS